MPDPKRAVRAAAALDDVSAHMGEILRRADDLLVEWSRFGAQVRGQVDREAQHVGHAVAAAVDTAVARATTAAVEQSLADQIGGKLAALSAEIGRLETRARAASRAVGEERAVDRRVLWAVVAGVVIANGLLVALLLREPRVTVTAPQPEPARVEPPAAAPVPVPAPSAGSGSAAPAEPADKIDAITPGSAAPSKQAPEPVKPPHAAAAHPVKTGPPAGTRLLAIPPRRK